MKKVLGLLVVSILLVSCGQEYEHTKDDKIQVVSEEVVGGVTIAIIKVEGVKYVMNSHGGIIKM